jgi:[acyl-carrier-protein] S-malonyltransferase
MEPEAPTAIVFPGMGPTPFADVARFMLINPHARALLAIAEDTLGYPLFERYRDGAGDYTEYSQVAFLVNCLALAYWAEESMGARPDFCAGPSFGGKAAAVYSGVLDLPQAVWLTAQLARREEEYFATEHRDVVTLSFTRTPPERLAEVLGELDGLGEWHDISCYIDEDFYMVSLRRDRVDWFQERLRSFGGFPLYTMDPPMHCRAFGPLRDRIEREVFAELRLADPDLPVVADQDGELLTSAEGVRRMLLDGYVAPVRWPSVVATLRRLGVGRLYVSGPDSLFGRVGCTTRAFDVVPVNPRAALRPRRRSVVA